MRTLSDFIGTWIITREIDDLRAGAQAHLSGVCQLNVDTAQGRVGDVIQYETGKLSMPGMTAPIAAERRYIWRSGQKDIAVHFEDGRFFHSFDPNETRPEAGHDCTPDRYDVVYDFSNWRADAPKFWAQWTVSGPRKSYVSRTEFIFVSKA